MRKANQVTPSEHRIIDGVEVVDIAKDGGMPIYVPVGAVPDETPVEDPAQ